MRCWRRIWLRSTMIISAPTASLWAATLPLPSLHCVLMMARKFQSRASGSIISRAINPGIGATGLGDGNPNTAGDVTCSPLGAPASNLTGPNFTPPFPSYPSGHGGFGGALFQTLRRFYGTDNVAFTFVSDEFNGVTRDNDGNIRPLLPRSFSSLSQAEEENGQSRIYLAMHWSFDKVESILLGRRVGDYVFDNTFVPLHGHGR